MSNVKVIDLAYKYGYDSPESFSKAFRRFHGITPSQAKKADAPLNSFNRLVIKISTEGGTIMQYRIVEKESFQLIAKVDQFETEAVDENGKEVNKIAQFWEESRESGVFEELMKHAETDEFYGVCTPISQEKGTFEFGIGVRHDGGEVPVGYQLWTLSSREWAVFKCIGTEPSSVSETWDRINQEFEEQSGYKMLEETDYEFYPEEKEANVFCELWMPVEKQPD